ncbi:hypothetical protein ZHAS_00016922 [Anopheles sinensis]|uniref:Uncharacterized protein n=1 Tax=Anopheles sinensis TaxID=74873 RepID=A0A084WFD2_ANOSI|nr:hypothetical protein ZHAS_00016922 [Anopheles sinensis]
MYSADIDFMSNYVKNLPDYGGGDAASRRSQLPAAPLPPQPSSAFPPITTNYRQHYVNDPYYQYYDDVSGVQRFYPMFKSNSYHAYPYGGLEEQQAATLDYSRYAFVAPPAARHISGVVPPTTSVPSSSSPSTMALEQQLQRASLRSQPSASYATGSSVSLYQDPRNVGIPPSATFSSAEQLNQHQLQRSSSRTQPFASGVGGQNLQGPSEPQETLDFRLNGGNRPSTMVNQRSGSRNQFPSSTSSSAPSCTVTSGALAFVTSNTRPQLPTTPSSGQSRAANDAPNVSEGRIQNPPLDAPVVVSGSIESSVPATATNNITTSCSSDHHPLNNSSAYGGSTTTSLGLQLRQYQREQQSQAAKQQSSMSRFWQETTSNRPTGPPWRIGWDYNRIITNNRKEVHNTINEYKKNVTSSPHGTICGADGTAGQSPASSSTSSSSSLPMGSRTNIDATCGGGAGSEQQPGTNHLPLRLRKNYSYSHLDKHVRDHLTEEEFYRVVQEGESMPTYWDPHHSCQPWNYGAAGTGGTNIAGVPGGVFVGGMPLCKSFSSDAMGLHTLPPTPTTSSGTPISSLQQMLAYQQPLGCPAYPQLIPPVIVPQNHHHHHQHNQPGGVTTPLYNAGASATTSNVASQGSSASTVNPVESSSSTSRPQTSSNSSGKSPSTHVGGGRHSRLGGVGKPQPPSQPQPPLTSNISDNISVANMLISKNNNLLLQKSASFGKASGAAGTMLGRGNAGYSAGPSAPLSSGISPRPVPLAKSSSALAALPTTSGFGPRSPRPPQQQQPAPPPVPPIRANAPEPSTNVSSSSNGERNNVLMHTSGGGSRLNPDAKNFTPTHRQPAAPSCSSSATNVTRSNSGTFYVSRSGRIEPLPSATVIGGGTDNTDESNPHRIPTVMVSKGVFLSKSATQIVTYGDVQTPAEPSPQDDEDEDTTTIVPGPSSDDDDEEDDDEGEELDDDRHRRYHRHDDKDDRGGGGGGGGDGGGTSNGGSTYRGTDVGYPGTKEQHQKWQSSGKGAGKYAYDDEAGVDDTPSDSDEREDGELGSLSDADSTGAVQGDDHLPRYSRTPTMYPKSFDHYLLPAVGSGGGTKVSSRAIARHQHQLRLVPEQPKPPPRLYTSKSSIFLETVDGGGQTSRTTGLDPDQYQLLILGDNHDAEDEEEEEEVEEEEDDHDAEDEDDEVEEEEQEGAKALGVYHQSSKKATTGGSLRGPTKHQQHPVMYEDALSTTSDNQLAEEQCTPNDVEVEPLDPAPLTRLASFSHGGDAYPLLLVLLLALCEQLQEATQAHHDDDVRPVAVAIESAFAAATLTQPQQTPCYL